MHIANVFLNSWVQNWSELFISNTAFKSKHFSIPYLLTSVDRVNQNAMLQ